MSLSKPVMDALMEKASREQRAAKKRAKKALRKKEAKKAATIQWHVTYLGGARDYHL